jgi:hypothetical protein
MDPCLRHRNRHGAASEDCDPQAPGVPPSGAASCLSDEPGPRSGDRHGPHPVVATPHTRSIPGIVPRAAAGPVAGPPPPPGSMPTAVAWSSARRHASAQVAPSARIMFSPFVPVTTQT